MTKATHLLEEFEQTTTKPEGVVIDATGPSPCTVCEWPIPAEEPTPEDYLSPEELLEQLSAGPDSEQVVTESRQWIADTFYGMDGDTVRTMRLRKGWSQKELANALATSQPHVARIERGRENLYIETCRKLCKALDIDMNTLDAALRRQEALAHAKDSDR